MTHAVLASMIYAPLRPLLRLWRIVIYFLCNFDHILQTDFDRYAHTETGRRELEAGIAFGEDGINIMIYARTCELLGITPVIRRPVFQEPAKSRPIAELLARHARMLDRLRTFEQRAQRRAARILRQIEQSGPLRLATTLQSTSPTLHMVEDSVIVLEVLHRRRRGRWIARACAQDGGGEARSAQRTNWSGGPIRAINARSASERPGAQPRGPLLPTMSATRPTSPRRPHPRERPRMTNTTIEPFATPVMVRPNRKAAP